jgi:outer membrane protein assembly factor BamB
MQEVELLDGEAPDAPGPTVPSARRRRGRRWVVLVAALVAVALVGFQQVVDARDRAAWERVAALDGVVRPLGDTLDVAAVAESRIRELDAGERDAGPTIQVTTVADGSQAVTSTLAGEEEPSWSTTVLGADPARASAAASPMGMGTVSRCAPALDDEAVCLVSDGYEPYSEDGPTSPVAATTTRLVVLDSDDGGIVAEWPTTGAVALTTLPGLAVVPVPDEPAGVATVIAYDQRSGGERWRYVLRPPQGENLRSWVRSIYLFTAGELVVVASAGTLVLLDAEGQLVRDDLGSANSYGYAVKGTLVVSTMSAGREVTTTTVVAPDGDPAADRVYLGEIVTPGVDAGSVPGLVLTTTSGSNSLAEQIGDEAEAAGTGPGVRGYDSETGEERWFVSMSQEANGMQSSVIVLDERVLVTSPDAAVVALDAHTATRLWSAPEGGAGLGIFTDGRLVFSAVERPDDEGGGTQLVGWDLDTGDEVWSAPLTEDIDALIVVNHTLLGRNYDTGATYQLG